ncbi:MAG: hypothetical protein JXR76_21485 [Deltaproteobacteria bacterium]|nr:hypothetical protein [Deltaproteobacteria bacterium]
MHRVAFVFLSLLCIPLIEGCSGDKRDSKLSCGAAAKLYDEGAHIFGFERFEDWRNTRANSIIHTDGAISIEVMPSGLG